MAKAQRNKNGVKPNGVVPKCPIIVFYHAHAHLVSINAIRMLAPTLYDFGYRHFGVEFPINDWRAASKFMRDIPIQSRGSSKSRLHKLTFSIGDVKDIKSGSDPRLATMISDLKPIVPQGSFNLWIHYKDTSDADMRKELFEAVRSQYVWALIDNATRDLVYEWHFFASDHRSLFKTHAIDAPREPGAKGACDVSNDAATTSQASLSCRDNYMYRRIKGICSQDGEGKGIFVHLGTAHYGVAQKLNKSGYPTKQFYIADYAVEDVSFISSTELVAYELAARDGVHGEIFIDLRDHALNLTEVVSQHLNVSNTNAGDGLVVFSGDPQPAVNLVGATVQQPNDEDEL